MAEISLNISQQVKMKNVIKVNWAVECDSEDEEGCDMQPSGIMDYLIEGNYLPNFVLNQDLRRHNLLCSLKHQTLASNEPHFEFTKLYDPPTAQAIDRVV